MFGLIRIEEQSSCNFLVFSVSMVICYVDHWHCIYIHLSAIVHVSQEQRENFHQQFLPVQECLFAHCKNVQKCLQWVQWSQRCRLSISAVRSGPRQTCKHGLTMFGMEITIPRKPQLWFAHYRIQVATTCTNASFAKIPNNTEGHRW